MNVKLIRVIHWHGVEMRPGTVLSLSIGNALSMIRHHYAIPTRARAEIPEAWLDLQESRFGH
ncbi:hypothetical protein CI610_00348 [invertebrate metagenome]|uniref:Uncharacterized protein n=1 Tax=invertebrate metagenome TaxID=1711999 RepID=A0A2H9TBW1_9ZZZZ